MSALTWILMGALIGYMIVIGTAAINESVRSADKPAALGMSAFSPVSQAIIKEYEELPKESRPVADIKSLLKDMDSRTALDSVARDYHFSARDYYGRTSGFSWNKARCYHDDSTCEFRDYGRLHYAIETAKEGVALKERALLKSQYSSTSTEVELLEERLRAEANLNTELAKELTV